MGATTDRELEAAAMRLRLELKSGNPYPSPASEGCAWLIALALMAVGFALAHWFGWIDLSILWGTP